MALQEVNLAIPRSSIANSMQGGGVLTDAHRMMIKTKGIAYQSASNLSIAESKVKRLDRGTTVVSNTPNNASFE